jgi:predicted nucleic acid-binding protein
MSDMMVRVFFDNNVLFDLIDDQRPNAKESISFFDAAYENKDIAFSFSSDAITTLAHVLKKKPAMMQGIFTGLDEDFDIAPLSRAVFLKANELAEKYPSFNDYEDLVIVATAILEKGELIITNDGKLLKAEFEEIEIASPKDMLLEMGWTTNLLGEIVAPEKEKAKTIEDFYQKLKESGISDEDIAELFKRKLTDKEEDSPIITKSAKI